MVGLITATSSLFAGAYIVWKGYCWFRKKPKQVARWAIPRILGRPHVANQCAQKRTVSIFNTSDSDTIESLSLKRRHFQVSNCTSSSDSQTEAGRSDFLGEEACAKWGSGEPYDKCRLKQQQYPRISQDEFKDRFEIVGTVGKGTFGIVYKAVLLDKQSVVAVKCVPVAADVDVVMNEVDVLKSVQDCPFVVRLLDYFHVESKLAIVMNFAPCCLREIDLNSKRDEYIMTLFLDIQNAVSFLHYRMIAHRDLKPGNILVADDRAILADFGSAKDVRGPYNYEMYSRGVVGTLSYIAPEVLKNVCLYSALRADVWSIGCVIYFLLVGEDLFMGENTEYTVMEHIETAVELPESVEETPITSSLTTSMTAALQYEPDLRPVVGML